MRFTIRELVLVTALIAVALSWWLDLFHQKTHWTRNQDVLTLERDRLRAQLQKVQTDGYQPPPATINFP